MIWGGFTCFVHDLGGFTCFVHDLVGFYLLLGEQQSFLSVDLLEEVSSLTVIHDNIQTAALYRKTHRRIWVCVTAAVLGCSGGTNPIRISPWPGGR